MSKTIKKADVDKKPKKAKLTPVTKGQKKFRLKSELEYED